jgi:hypothetical protein
MDEPEPATSGDPAQGESARVITRGYVDILIGVALLVGGLIALCFPVALDTYDQWGVRVQCGNGYHAELLQASIVDSGAPTARPTTLHRCENSLVQRRAWAMSVAGVGGLLILLEIVAWARAESTSPGAPPRPSAPGGGDAATPWSAGPRALRSR